MSISTSPTYDVLDIGISIVTLEFDPQVTSTTMYDSPIGHLLRRSYERNSTIQFHIVTLRFIVIRFAERSQCTILFAWTALHVFLPHAPSMHAIFAWTAPFTRQRELTLLANENSNSSVRAMLDRAKYLLLPPKFKHFHSSKQNQLNCILKRSSTALQIVIVVPALPLLLFSSFYY